jgi:hypothetical protein
LKKIAIFIGFIVIVTIAGLGQRWYAYVTNTQSPYEDDIGMEINARAPGFINAWGCAQLAENFPNNAIPPYGCN